MKTMVRLTALWGVIAIGCDGSSKTAPVSTNPYEDRPEQHQEAFPAPPSPPRRLKSAAPTRSAPRVPARFRTKPKSAPGPSSPAAKRSPVRDAGDHAVQATLSEYSRMARRTTDLLKELTEIHIAVDDSGDVGPYQERWGELTADLTRLHRQVLETGYPPADVVLHLSESQLPLLNKAITEAAQAMEQHTGVESGFALCHAEAEAISAHLKQSHDDPQPE